MSDKCNGSYDLICLSSLCCFSLSRPFFFSLSCLFYRENDDNNAMLGNGRLIDSADGHYELKLNTKAIVHHNGLVAWQPPATYKSACDIDVEYFPLDIQTCFLKLGSWTYAGYQVRIHTLVRSLCSACAPTNLPTDQPTNQPTH